MDYTKVIYLLENMLKQKESIKYTVIQLTEFLTPELEEIFSNLEHYFADEDIRAKESEYKDFQDNELEKLIHYIKVGNIEKANQISFLQVTPNI